MSVIGVKFGKSLRSGAKKLGYALGTATAVLALPPVVFAGQPRKHSRGSF